MERKFKNAAIAVPRKTRISKAFQTSFFFLIEQDLHSQEAVKKKKTKKKEKKKSKEKKRQNMTAPQPAAPSPAGPGQQSFQSPSIYVGDLDGKVTEAMLYDHFRAIGPVVSVRVCIDSQTHKSLGYGYVNFQNPADAERAIENLNGTKLMSKACRVARIQRDPTQRKTGLSNIVVKGLPANIDNNEIKALFVNFGRITSIKVPTNEEGSGRGYAYVMFEKEESARKAVEDMNGVNIDSNNPSDTIAVERYKNPAAIREEAMRKFTNLYVKNLDKTVDDVALQKRFEQFGPISSAKVRVDDSGSMGFGWVAFLEHDSAVAAIEQMNDSEELAAEGEKLSVKRFMYKKERQRAKELAYRERQATYAKFPNLYVKNFDDNITSDQLKDIFEQYGKTLSVKVQLDPITKMSRGFGFVSFKEHQAAQEAVRALAGSRALGSRPLFVTYALRRDARRQQFEDLQKKRQRIPGGGLYGGAMGGPMGLAGPMGQPGLGPGMGMGGPMAGPMGMGGIQQYGRPQMGGPQMQQRPMMMQPQVGGVGQLPVGIAPGMMGARTAPMPPRPQPKPAMPQAHPSGLDAQYLASMSPEQQKNVLGERLYTYIVKKYPKQSAKITGMLLEMDNSEILNLLDSPQLLDSKVEEAIEVLERHDNRM